MIRPTLSPVRALPVALVLVAGLSCWSTAAFAQSAPAAQAAAPDATSGDTIRLTDEQRAKILDSNTVESAAAARGELTGSELRDRGVHGEVGVMVGTNGLRAAYGTAEIPLGDNGQAMVAFETSHFGRR
jgi:hypothetical protein